MLNKVMIIGRLGRDPELRYSQSGSPVCTLNIATDESYTDRDATEIKAQRVQFLDKRGGEQGGMPSGAGGSEGGYSAPRRPAAAQQGGGSRPQQRPQQRQDDYEDLGPAFPSEASGMDDVPF